MPKRSELKRVDKLPYEVAEEGVDLFRVLARHYYMEIPGSVFMVGAVPSAYKPIFILLLTFLLLVGKIPSVMRKEEPLLWGVLTVCCVSQSLILSIVLYNFIDPYYGKVPDIQFSAMSITTILVILIPVFICSHKMASSFELAFYRTKGFDFCGKKENIEDWW